MKRSPCSSCEGKIVSEQVLCETCGKAYHGFCWDLLGGMCRECKVVSLFGADPAWYKRESVYTILMACLLILFVFLSACSRLNRPLSGTEAFVSQNVAAMIELAKEQ